MTTRAGKLLHSSEEQTDSADMQRRGIIYGRWWGAARWLECILKRNARIRDSHKLGQVTRGDTRLNMNSYGALPGP